jgi:phosphatidylinositol glycan class A protein
MPLLQNTLNPVPNHLRIPVRLYPSISPHQSLTGLRTVTIVVLSRLAYRKGIDLLVATAPRICALFPNVNFVVGE